jgi:hypothetical protein
MGTPCSRRLVYWPIPPSLKMLSCLGVGHKHRMRCRYTGMVPRPRNNAFPLLITIIKSSSARPHIRNQQSITSLTNKTTLQQSVQTAPSACQYFHTTHSVYTTTNTSTLTTSAKHQNHRSCPTFKLFFILFCLGFPIQ